MGAINFTGLGSGLDTNRIVEELVNLERRPIRQLQRRKLDFQSQLNIVSDLKSKLQSLQTQLQSMDTPREFIKRTASSNDTNIVTATATGEANPTKFDVTVTQLARPGQWKDSRGTPYASTSSTIEQGTYTITQNATAYNIVIGPTNNTVQGFMDAVNGTSGLNVTASALPISGGVRLLLSSDLTGTTNDFSVTAQPAGPDAPTFASFQAALNANMTISGETVVSQSNTVTGISPGLTLQLLDTSATAVTVEVANDTDGMVAAVQGFVSRYNDVATALRAQMTWDGTRKGDNTLYGDTTVRSILGTLQRRVSSTVGGLPSDMNALSQLGIKTNRDGTLSIDEAVLRREIDEDAIDVSRVFVDDDSFGTEGVASLLDTDVEGMLDPADGTLTAKTTAIGDRMRQVDDSIDRLETRVAKFEERMRSQFVALERAMATMRAQGDYLGQQLSRLR